MKHNEFIAQLRAVAILAVVLMHYGYCFKISYSNLSFIGNGYYGVALFFAISGFLITSNMIARYGATGSVDLRAFYDMRAARILPCLGLAVAILTVIALTAKLDGFTFQPGLSPGEAIISLLTLQFNGYYLAGAQNTLAWAVLWSISIEETFYLIYPIVAIVLRREIYLVALLVGIVGYGPFARPNVWGLFSYFGCFDLMAMGALAAIAARRFLTTTPISILPYLKGAGAILVLVTYLTLSAREHYTIGPGLIALGASLMLFASAIRPHRTGETVLGRIGSLSYEIYLFHSMIFLLLAQVIPATTGLLSYLVFAGTMLVCYRICAAIAERFSVPINAAIRARLASASLDLGCSAEGGL